MVFPRFSRVLKGFFHGFLGFEGFFHGFLRF